ncbi:MAG: hypothetical protein KJ882_02890, partial [Proteobacteria bacterium]|nr:hypothetical protein [Pseudomonadota bacterium]
VADVYAEKGGAKIVFEIQLSPQTQFEMVRRQEKYKISDIRCAWFTKRRIHDFHMSDDNYDVPNFAIDLAEDKKKFIVCRFDVDLEEFVSGMLAGKLKMPGIENRIAHTGLIIGYDKCWKCHKWTNVILGLLHMDDENSENFVYSGYGCGFLKFEQISYLINSKFLTENVRIKHKIGLIKERYSRTTESSYLSNGCFHCDALMGNHFLKNLFEKICYVGRFPSPKICRKLVYGKDIPVQEYKHWTFDWKNGGGP